MRLASLFRHTPTVVCQMDADDGSFVDVNPAFERVLGYRREDVIGKLPLEIGLWPDPQVRAQVWGRLRVEQRVHELSVSVIGRDRRLMSASLSCELIEVDQHRFVLCLLHDPVLAPAHAIVIEERETYRTLFQAASEGIYRRLPYGGFIDANPAMARILGYDSPAALIQRFARAGGTLYADPTRAEALLAQIESEGRIEQARSRMIRQDGAVIWVSENIRAVRDADGQTVFHEGTLIDITGALAAEAALRQSEALYKALVDNSREGVFLIQRGIVKFANRALERMLGAAPGELIGTRYMDLVHPDDVGEQTGRRVAREGGSRDAQRYEVRLVRRNGTAGLFAVHADAVEYDGDIASTGVLRDITEERRRQQALEEAERRYRQLFENSPVGLYKTALDGRILAVNPALLRMLGYATSEEFRAQHATMLDVYADPGEREQLVAELQRCGEIRDREISIRGRSGLPIWVRINVQVIQPEEGGDPEFTGSVQDVTRHREAEQRLRFNATHDALTGLPNRLLFQQRLEARLRAAREGGTCDYAVLFLDLDGFKLVNDSMGHAAGDLLLVNLAAKISAELRGEALVARYGGDEFTILPDGPCDADRACAIAHRVIGLFEGPIDIGEQHAFSSASVGIVVGRAEYRGPVQVMRDADTAMYRAKAAGKAGYVLFDEAMHAAARARFQLETDLRVALDRDEFCVHYQPIVDLATHRVLGCEALVRWRHPQRGLLLPAEFLAVTEETGLIARLDGWVLQHACTQVADWQRRYPHCRGLRLNVNIDDRQINAEVLVAEVERALDNAGLAAGCLQLEVTETVFRAGRQHVEDTLRALKNVGVGLVVDDFGTGYSSLDSFASSPFDALKIDRNFVRDMETNARHRAIVRTITAFADDLGLALTAEGIETKAQAGLLHNIGCTSGQGFLFAPALEAAAFAGLLEAGAVCAVAPVIGVLK